MNSITMDDYSIVVEDLPTDVTADRIRKHFEKFGVVNEVVMGYGEFLFISIQAIRLTTTCFFKQTSAR